MFIANFELPLWFVFLSCTATALFLFADEEPALDPTDWNLTHVVLLVISAVVVCWDNIIRARFGQFVYKDQVLAFSALIFWFGIDWWVRLIVLVFFFHCLVALEADLFEVNDPFLSMLSWSSSNLLFTLIAFYVVYALLVWANTALNWHTVRALIWSVNLATILLGGLSLVFVLDLALNSLSGCDMRDSYSQTYYNQPRTALSYDHVLATNDVFDWHASQHRPVTLHLEELASFYVSLLSAVSLVFAFFFLINFAIDLNLRFSTGALASMQQPFVFLGVTLRWLDHAIVVALVSPFSIFVISTRLWLRVNFFLAV